MHLIACQMVVFQDGSFQVLSRHTIGYGYLSRAGTNRILVQGYFYRLVSVDENYPWALVDLCTGTLTTGLRPWSRWGVSIFAGRVIESKRLDASLISIHGGLPKIIPNTVRISRSMAKYLTSRCSYGPPSQEWWHRSFQEWGSKSHRLYPQDSEQ